MKVCCPFKIEEGERVWEGVVGNQKWEWERDREREILCKKGEEPGVRNQVGYFHTLFKLWFLKQHKNQKKRKKTEERDLQNIHLILLISLDLSFFFLISLMIFDPPFWQEIFSTLIWLVLKDLRKKNILESFAFVLQ